MDDNKPQKKKKFVPTKITVQQSEPVLAEKFSENGSLILHEFRLNETGIKIQSQQLLQDLPQLQTQVSHNFSLDKLKPIGSLGEGASGKVEKVQHMVTGEFYAMKKIAISTDELKLKQISEELKFMLECDSPYVVKCYGAFYKQGILHIILEYMDVGSIAGLVQRVKKVTEPVMALITQQILLGIDYLHYKKKIIHRDIKPQNILLNSKGEIKITDFGISGTAQTLEKRQTYVGTAIYMSPERLQGDKYDRDSDLWSLGMMIAECLIGYHPIVQKGVNFIQMVESINNFKVSEYNEISAEMKLVIEWCCKINPLERPTTQDILKSKIIRRAEKVDRKIFTNWIKFVFKS